MADKIYGGKEGFSPGQPPYKDTFGLTNFDTSAISSLVDMESQAVESDLKKLSQGVNQLSKLKDLSTGLQFVSDKNKQAFESIKESAMGPNSLQNITVDDLTNPVRMMELENSLENALEHPMTKRIIKSEMNAERFYENLQQINNPQMRQKAANDYKKSLEAGADQMLSLNANNYEFVDVIKETKYIFNASKGAKYTLKEKDKEGNLWRRTYKTVDKDAAYGNFRYKYQNDPKFKNNLDAYIGSNDDYDSPGDFFESLYSNVGRDLFSATRLDPEDGKTEGATYTYGTFLGNAGSSNQKSAAKMRMEKEGLMKPNGLTEEERQKILELSKVWSDNDAANEESYARIFGGQSGADGVSGTDAEKEKEKEELEEEKAAALKDVREEEDMDFSWWPGYRGGFDKIFGVEGGAKKMERVMKGTANDKYKGSIDEDGNLITSNARWVYEDYLGNTQWALSGDVNKLKEQVKDNDNIEFKKGGDGVPPHFVIKDVEFSKFAPQKEEEQTESAVEEEIEGVTEFPVDKGMSRTGVPRGYSSYKANNPLNVRTSSGSNTFNVYQTMEQGVKAGAKLLDRYYSGKNRSLIENKDKFFDTKGEPVTLKEVIYTWSPPENLAEKLGKPATGNSEEKVEAYVNSVANGLGVDPNTPVKDIPKEDLALEMTKIECPKCYEDLKSGESPKGESPQTEPTKVNPLDTLYN